MDRLIVLLVPVLVAAAVPLAADARPTRSKIHFKPGVYKGRTTQGLPVSFKASKTRVSNFRVEVELHCYRPAPYGSEELYVFERSYRETFSFSNKRFYIAGPLPRKRNYFRFAEQPDADTVVSSPMAILKGVRSYGDVFVTRDEGELECQAARRETSTGAFTERTPSFDIRRK